MVTEQQLLKQLKLEERAAVSRLRILRAKVKQKVRVAALKKKISKARSAGKTPLLSVSDKALIKKRAKQTFKKAGFFADVIAYGYASAKKKQKKRR